MEIVQNKSRMNDNMGRQNTYANPFILERADPFMIKEDENADLLDIVAWTKFDRPLLTSEDLVDEYGPGHNSFTKDEDGKPILNGREK